MMGDHTRPIVIAMKGHPGTGKSTLAQSIVGTLKFPLVDKDHFLGCTFRLQQALSQSPDSLSPSISKLLNDLSYEAMWRVASAQLALGLGGVVVVSPLSRRAYFDRLLQMAANADARVVIVECKPRDEAEWRRRVAVRGATDESSWHKPTWQGIEDLLESYGGCWNYDVGQVPKIVVDTTSPVDIQRLLSSVMDSLVQSPQ